MKLRISPDRRDVLLGLYPRAWGRKDIPPYRTPKMKIGSTGNVWLDTGKWVLRLK